MDAEMELERSTMFFEHSSTGIWVLPSSIGEFTPDDEPECEDDEPECEDDEPECEDDEPWCEGDEPWCEGDEP